MRILLVEDEEDVAKFVKKGLEQKEYQVTWINDGSLALKTGSEEPFDLMILDVNLPGMNGVDLCRTFREKGLHTPVLMLTVRSALGDKVAGLDSGADDYMTKPFEVEEFLARVRALLRRKESEVLTLKLGLLEIDVLTRKVVFDKTTVDLRPKEFAILEYLMRNAGKVISRAQILENVWEYDFDPGTNVLEVHVKMLRDRLREAGAGEPIRTIRGAGYIIETTES